MIVNTQLVDHEERIGAVESVVGIEEPTYDLRTGPERQAARLDNHDQRLRALEHRITMLEIAVRDLSNATASADGV